MKTGSSGHRLLATLLAFVFVATAPSVRADEGLRPDLTRIALAIKKNLDGRDVDSIAVNQFSPPAGHLSNSGPGIEDVLSQELQKIKIKVDPEASFKVQGEFVKGLVPAAGRPSDLLLLKLKFRIYDRSGEEIDVLPVEIRNNATLGRVLGATGALSANGDVFQRNQDLQNNLNNKAARIDGTKVIPSANSPFAVEILVKPNVKARAEPRQPRFEGNEPFVNINRGEIYEVRVHNESRLEAAVTLNIDGLSVFTFSELRNPKTGVPKYGHYIIPKGATTITGWHKRNNPPDNILSFLVTEYGQGVSRHVPQLTGKVGVITVEFAFAWDGPTPPPEERSAQDGGNETGFGPPVSATVNEVRRQIGIVRDQVTIRYSR